MHLLTARARSQPSSSPRPWMGSHASVADTKAPASSQRAPITDRMVETVTALTILELEEHLIPAQGVEDILYVYTDGIVVTHDIRRTLEVFDGDMGEAIDSIHSFIVDGIVGTSSP